MERLKSFKSWEALPGVWLGKASVMVEVSNVYGVSRRVLYAGDDLAEIVAWSVCYSGDINYFNNVVFFRVNSGIIDKKATAKLVVERQSSPYSYYFSYKVFTLNEDGSFKDCIYDSMLFQPNVD